MTSTERAALLAKVRGTAAPAPTAAPASAAKKSSTSRGRGRVAKAAAPVEPAEPAEPDEAIWSPVMPTIAVPDERARDIERAKMVSQTAKKSDDESAEMARRQAPLVREMVEKYGKEGEIPAYVGALESVGDLPPAVKGALGGIPGAGLAVAADFLTAPMASHRARYLGEAMKKEQGKDERAQKVAEARTKALGLVSGDGPPKGGKLAKLLELESKVGALEGDYKAALAPKYQDNEEALRQLKQHVKGIAEAAKTQRVARKGDESFTGTLSGMAREYIPYWGLGN